MNFRLIQCNEAGEPLGRLGELPPAVESNCRGSAELYRRIGFNAPWVSYVAVDGETAVGGGAFIGAPRDGRVEIAYFTVPEMAGRGYATHTATNLCRIARGTCPDIVITAFTLPETNASTAILAKLGFRRFGTAVDPDAGEVWEWRSDAAKAANPAVRRTAKRTAAQPDTHAEAADEGALRPDFPSMQYQLVLRFRSSSLAPPDDIQSLERALSDTLGDTAKVDGHDTGTRDINLFIVTPDPASAFRRSKPVLQRFSLLDKLTAAHRLEGGARFTVVWPLGYRRKFNLP